MAVNENSWVRVILSRFYCVNVILMTHLTAFLDVGGSKKLGDHYIAGPRASEVGGDRSPWWLRLCLPDLFISLLCHLCNQSLQSGVFPASQKQAIVFPVLKKPTLDPDCTSSYRPISNLTFASKVLERVVTRRLVAHVNSFHLFPQ